MDERKLRRSLPDTQIRSLARWTRIRSREAANALLVVAALADRFVRGVDDGVARTVPPVVVDDAARLRHNTTPSLFDISDSLAHLVPEQFLYLRLTLCIIIPCRRIFFRASCLATTRARLHNATPTGNIPCPCHPSPTPSPLQAESVLQEVPDGRDLQFDPAHDAFLQAPCACASSLLSLATSSPLPLARQHSKAPHRQRPDSSKVPI